MTPMAQSDLRKIAVLRDWILERGRQCDRCTHISFSAYRTEYPDEEDASHDH